MYWLCPLTGALVRGCWGDPAQFHGQHVLHSCSMRVSCKAFHVLEWLNVCWTQAGYIWVWPPLWGWPHGGTSKSLARLLHGDRLPSLGVIRQIISMPGSHEDADHEFQRASARPMLEDGGWDPSLGGKGCRAGADGRYKVLIHRRRYGGSCSSAAAVLSCL